MTKEELLGVLRRYLVNANLLQENLLDNGIVFNLSGAFQYFIREVDNLFPDNTDFNFRHDLYFFPIINILTRYNDSDDLDDLNEGISSALLLLWGNLRASQNHEVNSIISSLVNMLSQLNLILDLHFVNVISNNDGAISDDSASDSDITENVVNRHNVVDYVNTDDEASIYSDEIEDEDNEGEVNIVGYNYSFGEVRQETNSTNTDQHLSGLNYIQNTSPHL